MRTHRYVPIACLALALGCSDAGSEGNHAESGQFDSNQFASESEELEYLTALSNPSVSQFKRRKELQTKVDTAVAERTAREREDQRTREKKVREAKAEELLAEAEELEKKYPDSLDFSFAY